MRYRATNITRKTLLGDRISRADTFVARTVGLLGKTALAPGEGLILQPCNSIHTFFMKMPIDVAFLDADFLVIDMCRAMAPWKMSRVYWSAKSVLELPAGVLEATSTVPSDRLELTALAE